MSNAWTTRTYHIEPRSKKFLLETYNRYAYVSAGDLQEGRDYRWARHQINMGAVPTHHVHTLHAPRPQGKRPQGSGKSR